MERLIIWKLIVFLGVSSSSLISFAKIDLNPPIWPKWVHKHYVWENTGTQESAFQLVEDYLAHDIPVGALIIDRPWQTQRNTFKPHLERYPDLADYISRLHDMDVRVLMWITSMVNEKAENFQEGKENGYFLENGKLVSWWGGKGAFLDYDNPDAVNWWHKQMDNILDMGIDGWKVDGIDPYVMALYPYNWLKGYRLWKKYRKQYYSDYFHYTRERLGNDRVIMARPSDDYIGWGLPLKFAPRDVNFAGWIGDQEGTWGGLRAAIRVLMTSGNLRQVNFGSDIGGFRTSHNNHMRDPKLLVRWTQLGAFVPIMENGGSGEHRPWMYGEEVLNIYRKFTKIHHSLITYLYSTGATSYQKGFSSVRPISKFNGRTYKLGDDLYIAPIHNSKDKRYIRFPRGKWRYLFDEGRTFKYLRKFKVPIDEYPVFVKDGSILPIDPVDGSYFECPLSKCDDYQMYYIYPTYGREKSFPIFFEDKVGYYIKYKRNKDNIIVKIDNNSKKSLLRLYGIKSVSNILVNGHLLNKNNYWIENNLLWVNLSETNNNLEVDIKLN